MGLLSLAQTPASSRFMIAGCAAAALAVAGCTSDAADDLIVRDYPKAFAPVAGKWGASGSTTVTLRAAAKRAVASALEAAWRKRAPKRLASTLDQ
jgi:hypothetical protein